MGVQNNQITAPRVDLIDENTGKIRREWYMFLYNLYTITGSGSGITPVVNGGTGLGTIPTNGQLLIGTGTGYALNTLGYGVGISVTNGSGTIVVANTGVLSNIQGTGISVSGATGNVTISNTGVLSFSGGTTGLTPNTATAGAVTLGGTLAIANGGTNGTATPTAGAVAYGSGTAYAFTSAGTSGQVLTSAGASTPTWTTPTTGTVTSVSGTGTVNGITLTGTVTSSGSLTLGGTLGGIGNSQLTNSTISGVALGSSLFNLTAGTGVSFSSGTTYNGSAAITINATGSGGTVTSVTGTSPVVSSGGTTPAISLAAAYGDTLNPYGTKTANYVLAGPTTGATTAPAFRALVAADIPSLPYGTGTVTSVSVVSANGFAGTVATATTTPAITISTSITGVLKGNGTAISAAVVNTDYLAPSAPVTKTANFTVADTDVWLINNKTGSTCTVTLPTASSWTGRVLRFQNYQVQTVVSASSNVVPLTGGAAGTSILLASSGDSATLVSDGTNWLVTQYIPNNILLLE